MTKFFAFLVAALIATTSWVSADEQKIGNLVLKHAWARATPAGAKTGAAYIRIENTADAPDQLVSVTSDIAAVTEIHEMSMTDHMMTMKPAGTIEIPPHGAVEFKPHGLHVMLMGLKKPLAEGDAFSVTLTFANAGKVDVQVVVGKVDDMGQEH